MNKLSYRLGRGSLSIKHQRADNSRKVKKVEEVLKSMMSIDHMEKMNLIAINNRCISKYSKIKRAEEISNRYSRKTPFLPNLKKINLDFKQSSPKGKRTGTELKKEFFSEEEEKIYEELIQDYMTKAEIEKELEGLGSDDRKELIENACMEIFKKVEERKSQLRLSQKRRKTEGTERNTSFHRSRHSFSAFEFQENLEQIKKSKSYGQKVRKLNERLFIRKLQHLNSIFKKSK